MTHQNKILTLLLLSFAAGFVIPRLECALLFIAGLVWIEWRERGKENF